jgi:alpha-L-fucosidase
MKIRRSFRNLLLASAALSMPFQMSAKEQDMTKGWHSSISSSKAKPETVQAWRDMGFGIFVHWTPAIVFQGVAHGRELNKDLWGEWYKVRAGVPTKDYKKRVKTWNPKLFNSKEWATIFKKSGAKYLVFVAKHHDGFALFNSKVNDFDIMHCQNFHRDVFKELTKALKKVGIESGFYYSHGTDWTNKEGKTEEQYWNEVVFPHLETLTKDYGKQDVVWFDLGSSKEYAKKCVDLVRKNNPNIMISSRVGGGYGDFSLGGDCDIPSAKSDKAWETCMTFDTHWDWYPASRDDKSGVQLIRMLSTIRARGGNLLLNVGPDVRGRIPTREKVALMTLGKWLSKNGDAIYGAHLTPYDDLPWGVCTKKDNTLYLHLMKLPRLDYLFLPGLKSEIKKAYILADKTRKPLRFKKVKYGYNINIADVDPSLLSEANTVVAVEFNGDLKVDTKPVLDLDLENRFIPAHARYSGGTSHGRTRVTPKYNSPGVESPCYYDYAWKFSKKGNKVSWNCVIPQNSNYFVKVKYANLTDKTLKAQVKVGEKVLELNLPPTLKDASSCFQTAISNKTFALSKSENANISFSIDDSSVSNELSGNTIKLKKFMLEWVEVSSFAPPLYEGYSDTKGL